VGRAEPLATGAGPAVVAARKYDTVRQEMVAVGTVRVATVDEAGLQAAARQIVAAYEEGLKRSQPLPGNEQTIVALAPISSFEHWIKLRGQIDTVQGIKSYRVIELGREAARIEIAFSGELVYLQRAFQQAGLALSRSDSGDDQWSVRLVDASPRTPEPPAQNTPGTPPAPGSPGEPRRP